MASLLGLSRVIGVGACCAACEKGAGACACSDVAEKTEGDEKATTYPFDENGNLLANPPVGAGDAPVVNNTSGSSSGPGFFTGLIIGVIVSGAAATLLYVGLSDEGARRASLARRRSAGYSY